MIIEPIMIISKATVIRSTILYGRSLVSLRIIKPLITIEIIPKPTIIAKAISAFILV